MKNAANHDSLLWLTQLLDQYGSMPHRWPTGCRTRAQDLLRTDAQAQQILKDHQVLDAQLATLPETPCQHLHKTILRNLPLRPSVHQRSTLPYATLLAAAILIGIFFGSQSTDAQRITHQFIAENGDDDLATFVAFID